MTMDPSPDRDNAGQTEQLPHAPTANKSPVTVTRIILFLTLLCALGAYAYDWVARRNVKIAADKLQKLDDDQEHLKFTDNAGVTPEMVQAELGRQPDAVTESVDDKNLIVTIEHYDFGGVFYRHQLSVVYQKTSFFLRAQPESVFRIGGKSIAR